jgi:Bacterial type II and III secretion system protein
VVTGLTGVRSAVCVLALGLAPPAFAANVRITTITSAERIDDASGASVSVHGPLVPPQPRVEVRGGTASSRSTSETRQDILVMAGGRAHIRVSEQVPYADWFWTWGQGQGLWTATTAWHDVGSGLLVEVLAAGGGTVRLRVTPEFSYFIDRERQVTSVQQLSTEVVAREGEEIDLGGTSTDREFEERFMVGVGRSGQRERVRIRLRARVEP